MVLVTGASEHSLNGEHSVLPRASAADDGEARQPRTVRHSTVCLKVKVMLSYVSILSLGILANDTQGMPGAS